MLERINRLGRRFKNIDESLVRPNLEMLHRALMHEWRTIHRESLQPCRQRNWTGDFRASPYRSLYDAFRRIINDSRIVPL